MHGYNPLAALTPRQQFALARRYSRAQLMPLLAQLDREFTGKQAGAAGYAEQLAGRLAPLAGQTHSIYAGAENEQRSVDEALANRLAAGGQGLDSELAKQLALAGQPVTHDAARIGAGAAAANQGLGSAAVGSLIGRGAAAENYAATLPGIARLGGLQASRQIEGERSLAADRLRSQIPGTLQRILADIRGQEFQKAAANLSYSGTLAGIQGQNQRSNMSLEERIRHDLSQETAQQRADRIRAQNNRVRQKQARRRQWWQEHKPRGKSGGSGPPSMRKKP